MSRHESDELQAAPEDQAALENFEERLSRYVVGIDLGTTNCAVSFVDTQQTPPSIQSFPVEQWVDFGTSQRCDLLPSFVYQPLASELESLDSNSIDSQSLEHASHGSESFRIVGELARDRGLQMPGRQIASAKSWLCHAGVDRRSPILPWQSDEGVAKLSPVQASSSYLTQIRRAWDTAFRDQPLAMQDVVLTLPASFDQVARQLTIEAAAAAGLDRVLPIEEPQAAFYAWLARHREDWENQVHPGQTVLVCDIGGGTTDFTLIRVREVSREKHVESSDVATATESGATETLDDSVRTRLSLHRVAVGQHLILGGDNIDLALAKTAENKLTGGANLPPRSWDALRQACRVAKETLLGDQPPSAYVVHLPGSGSRLIGGGQQIEITSAEVESCVLDGFFPKCNLTDRPVRQSTGFQEFGLPFASDASISKHLAAFLWDHRQDGRTDAELSHLSDRGQARPDWMLFNGGVMTSEQLRRRVVGLLQTWFAGYDDVDSQWMPGVLDGERLDLAVSKGAAYFGQVRRGQGVRIEAKLACAYYIQTSVDPPRGVCIMPGSASPGDRFRLTDQPMDLSIGQPVQFPVAFSSTRLADRAGQIVELDEEQFSSLPPIRTVLELTGTRRRDSLPVFIEVELTQIGTLQLFLQSSQTDHRWKLEFDVRGSTQTDHQGNDQSATQLGVLDERAAVTIERILADVFGPAGGARPGKLMSRLADELGMRRTQWPPSLLRAMWSSLIDLHDGRRQSAAHEARWLNLLGYCLRPGYGMAADDWRVAQTWRLVHGKLAFPSIGSRNEALILWRRIAGGFTPGQQLTVYQQVAGPLRGVLDPLRRGKGGGAATAAELIELLRLVGSLELLDSSEKSQLGDWLLELLHAKKWQSAQSAMLWTLGRLGSRVPAYGPLNTLVDSTRVQRWLQELCRRPIDDPSYHLALLLCARRVFDRYRDIDNQTRQLVVEQLKFQHAPEHYGTLVLHGGQLAGEEAAQVLGESLPLGLRID